MCVLALVGLLHIQKEKNKMSSWEGKVRTRDYTHCIFLWNCLMSSELVIDTLYQRVLPFCNSTFILSLSLFLSVSVSCTPILYLSFSFLPFFSLISYLLNIFVCFFFSLFLYYLVNIYLIMYLYS